MIKENTRILIIEDDNFLMNMYTTRFEKEGFKVLMAEDGEKGLKMAKKEKPDFILLDILLPKMNGFEVLKGLKEDEETKKIGVLLLTNLSQRGEVEEGLKLGALDYLIKAHFMPTEVVNKVKKYLVLE
jgi:DNA-binding response OmpR family regulator